jgi:predicted dinucleotide-utilizing enzyme
MIECFGATGKKTFLFENTPVAENPKTTYQACVSAADAIQHFASHYIVL